MVLKSWITGFGRWKKMRRSGNGSGWSGKKEHYRKLDELLCQKGRKKGQTETVKDGKDLCLRTLDTNPVCAKSVRENGKTQKNKRKPMKINLRLFYVFCLCGLRLSPQR